MGSCTSNLTAESLMSLDLDGLGGSQEAQLNSLSTMASHLLLPATLSKSVEDLAAFFMDVRRSMRENPYHNFSHICDVTQFVFWTLHSTNLTQKLTRTDLAAVYLAAVCHDLDHPGLSNNYLNNSKHDLSLRYNGESPLENHHVASFQKIAEKHALLSGVPPETRVRVERIIKEMVLSTDMGKHAAISKAAFSADNVVDPLASDENLMLFFSILLKCADISNPARPFHIASRWNDAVYCEFYNEGDLDAKAGRDVNPLHNRKDNIIPKSSVGFINFVVKPLFNQFATMLAQAAKHSEYLRADGLKEASQNLERNVGLYSAMSKQ